MKLIIDFENKEIGANAIVYIKNFLDEVAKANALEAPLEITGFKPRIDNADDAELIEVMKEIRKKVFALLGKPTQEKNNFNY